MRGGGIVLVGGNAGVHVGDGEREGLVAVLIVHLPQEHHLREQQRQELSKDEEESCNRYTWTCVRKVLILNPSKILMLGFVMPHPEKEGGSRNPGRTREGQ